MTVNTPRHLLWKIFVVGMYNVLCGFYDLPSKKFRIQIDTKYVYIIKLDLVEV